MACSLSMFFIYSGIDDGIGLDVDTKDKKYTTLCSIHYLRSDQRKHTTFMIWYSAGFFEWSIVHLE